MTIGRAQLTGLAEDLAAWTGGFYEQRARDAEENLPVTDVIMMQGDGKGIAMRPEHRKGGGTDPAHPGIKKMAEIVAVADFTPAAREPEDIAAPPARRQAHPGPRARDKWVSASVTESIEDMIAAAYDEADRRDPQRIRQRVFLADGNKQQITAIQAQAEERGLKVPVLIDYIHVSGYLGKAAAALHPGDPAAAGQWADGSCCASCTAAPKPSPPPSPPSPPGPALIPGPATSASPTWTGPSPCEVPNSCRVSDLGFYPRHSCSSASCTCLWSGCSPGWRCSPAAAPRRTSRSWCSGTRSRSCAVRSPARNRTGPTGP